MNRNLAKEKICGYGHQMAALGYANSNDGNLSIRLDDEEIWTTPTGVSKGCLTSDMLVRVNIFGDVLEGNRNPSSELKMHLRVYEKRKDVGGVVHAHPPMTTAFAVCRKPLDKHYLPEGVVSLGPVMVTEYATPSTVAVPDSIEPFLMDYSAVLLANHGVLTWDTEIDGAFYKMQTVEYLAQLYVDIEKIGSPVALPEEEVARLINLREFYRQYARR